MASTPESHRPINKSDSENGSGNAASYFQKTVCLHDWWLVRAENDFNGRKLAVAGFTSRPEQPVRIFSSAPIIRRYDIFTLETADGICVVIKGFINKMRTTDNGFSAEVFKHFVFGFPPNWETYAADGFEGEAFDSAIAGNISDTNKLLSTSENAGTNDCTPTDVNSLLCKNSPCKEGKEKLNVTPSNFGSKGTDRLRNLKSDQKSPLFKNLDELGKKETVTCGSNIERSKINCTPTCSHSVTNDGTSYSGCGISSLYDEQLSLVNKLDGCVECTSPEQNDGRQGLTHEDAMAQDVIQSANATKTDLSSTGLVGSHHKTCVDVPDEEIENKSKEEKGSRKKVKRKILFSTLGSPINRQGKEKKKNLIISPESLSYGRSRSGRLLLPTMEFWRNQLPVYDADRRIRGIQEGLPMTAAPRGSKSNPRRKQ